MVSLNQRHRDAPDEDHDGSRLAVLNMQRTCVHDGPGIRTTIFFRGCPLQCKWCQNPEAQAFVSPSSVDAGTSVAEILSVIDKDREYYRSTHGGVTLSGGDPLAQNPASLLSLLAALKSQGLHVAVETAGDVPWRVFEASLPYVDLFLFDLKVVGDARLHRELTGRPPHRIEENLRHLVAAEARIRFRMCIVPGHNDSTANFAATAALLRSLGQPAIELMRYYDLHEQKAERLELAQEPLHISAERSARALDAAAADFTARGIATEFVSPHAARRSATFTRRVHDIRQAIRDSGYHLCLESAELKTAFHKKHGFSQPVALRRANLLGYQLSRKTLTVYPDELIVGNYTSKRVGANLWVEYYAALMGPLIWTMDRQKPVSFQCSWAEKLRFYTYLAPFWLSRGLINRTYKRSRETGLCLARVVDQKAGFNNNLAGIAHYIVNCGRLLQLGTRGIAAEVADKRKRAGDQLFYDGVVIALKALEEFAARYAHQLRALAREEADPKRQTELEHMAEVCDHVPKNPARTFHEALQGILFLHIALCTESFENAISLGRLDQVLYPYYKADVDAQRLDYESAKELLACFILKIDEVVILNDGDALFQIGRLFESLSTVETVTVGGTDRQGADCTNDLTYMMLDVCELKPIGVNMAARIHRDSPDEYVERIARVYLSGSPMPALFNDEVYLAALQAEYATPLEEARNYSIVGCVEPVASDDHFANTDAANINVALPLLQALEGDTRQIWRRGILDDIGKLTAARIRSKLGRVGSRQRRWFAATALARKTSSLLGRSLPTWPRPNGATSPRDLPATMDQLLERYRLRLNELVHDVLAEQQHIEAALARNLTTPLASSMYRGCVDSGKDVYEGGATINSSGIQAVGVTDVADSLAAIDEVVFQKQLCSLADVLAAMDADFEGERHQETRGHLLAAAKFGDDGAADAHHWVNRVLQLFVDALRSADHKSRGGKYVAGYYGLNANMVYGKRTPALPSGRLQGQPLANSICPHFGMQMVDLTSALNAVAKVDFARFAPNGTTLTSTIDNGLFPGESGVRNLSGLIRGYFSQGGMQFQPNLIDRETLLDAYRNPGKHKDLVVRIAGYCGYFDELSDDLKLEIINRSYYTR